MPALSYQALGVVLLLLPGFLTAEVVRMLSARPDRTEFDKVLHAFIYSFIVYVAFSGLGGQFPASLHAQANTSGEDYFVVPLFVPLLELLFLAVLLGVVFALALNHDFPLALLRKWRITQRTLRTSVWIDTFNSFSGYVQVELADGRIVIGWLRFFSDTPEESALFLEDAAWIRKEDGEKFWIKGPGILLTKDSGIRHIMFLDAVETTTQ
jgi:hypothetical protein